MDVAFMLNPRRRNSMLAEYRAISTNCGRAQCHCVKDHVVNLERRLEHAALSSAAEQARRLSRARLVSLSKVLDAARLLGRPAARMRDGIIKDIFSLNPWIRHPEAPQMAKLCRTVTGTTQAMVSLRLFSLSTPATLEQSPDGLARLEKRSQEQPTQIHTASTGAATKMQPTQMQPIQMP